MRVSNVNRALSIPRLSYGVSSKALGMCWGPGALIAVMLGTSAGWLYAAIPVLISMLSHAILRWAFKKESRVFEIYKVYSVLASQYHPHARETIPLPFERPEKVGRGLRI
jgi:type IV secretory pathway TrbD component